MYEISSNHGRRYLMLKIQDGSQLTGSSKISDFNNDRQSEMAAETGNTCISETM